LRSITRVSHYNQAVAVCAITGSSVVTRILAPAKQMQYTPFEMPLKTDSKPFPMWSERLFFGGPAADSRSGYVVLVGCSGD
jgi:hypothetical protein